MRPKRADYRRSDQIFARLDAAYPDASCTLDFRTDWQLLFAAILATQTTDVRVNLITADLFVNFPDLEAFAQASQADIEAAIKTSGLYRNKARAIREGAQMLLEQFDGKVPQEMDQLLRLPGVGRKIANLIRGDWYGVPGMVVDTHNGRISKLLGLTNASYPDQVEQDLIKRVRPENWIRWGHLVVAHGREVCQARCRMCLRCPLRSLCQYGRRITPSDAAEDLHDCC